MLIFLCNPILWEAFSNVNIAKANGVHASGQYIKYTDNKHTAFMKGGVQIIDGSNTLNTEELTYNIRTKIGKYVKGGTIQTDETTISSEEMEITMATANKPILRKMFL